ncbi:MAG: TMEM165/GDT1 family protein [Patescibacteria group bacterium]
MNWRTFFVAFGALFLAEMGDKTQLAVFSLVTQSRAPLAVFLGASAALTAVTLVGVLLGGVVTRLVPALYLRLGSGILFFGIGAYTIWDALARASQAP